MNNNSVPYESHHMDEKDKTKYILKGNYVGMSVTDNPWFKNINAVEEFIDDCSSNGSVEMEGVRYDVIGIALLILVILLVVIRIFMRR